MLRHAKLNLNETFFKKNIKTEVRQYWYHQKLQEIKEKEKKIANIVKFPT